MINNWINCYLRNQNLKPKFKFDFFESYDFVLEHSNNINVLQSRNISVPISACLNNDLIVIGQQDGFFKVLSSNDLSFIYSLKSHNAIINDIKLRPQQSNHLLTASTDTKLILHDIETKQRLNTFQDAQHRSAIRTIDFYDSCLVASGTKNGKILIFDLREDSCKSKPIQVIHNAHLNLYKENLHSDFYKVVVGLKFNYLGYLYSCCSTDSFIRTWDIRFKKNTNDSPLNEIKYQGSSQNAEGFTSLTLDDKFDLYASCTDNKVYRHSYKTLISKSDLNNNSESNGDVVCFGGVSVSNYTKIQVLNDLKLLISGSSEAEACIWAKRNFINYPIIILPHILEECNIVLCNQIKYEIFTVDDANNVYKWILNSKLNNQTIKKYKKGRISKKFPHQNELKPFSPTQNRVRKRFLSGDTNDFASQRDESNKLPFKRSRSVIEKVLLT